VSKLVVCDSVNLVALRDHLGGWVLSHNCLNPNVIDYVSVASLPSLFQTYFAFDEVVFAKLTGGFLLVFVTGHTSGRIIGAMRKTF
jgi:hypothetical protein